MTPRRYSRRRLLLALALALVAGVLFWRALPAPLFAAPWSVVVEDRAGGLLGARIATDGQWRFPPGAAVPERFAAALQMQEDRRFRRHPGIDPLAIGRALRSNLAAGRVVSGASTLSMQVIRLARGNPPRTLREKLYEMLLALRLECGYSKDDILALYAAHAPFGGNVVGLEAAAWRWFGRAPATLSWAEAATLAVLPNSPGLVHPGRARAALQARRDRLLEKLAAAGAFSAEELALARGEHLPGAPLPLPRLAPHLVDTLAARVTASRVRTTIDAELQQHVLTLAQAQGETLAGRRIGNVAALVIDNRDFSVRAYVGNTCMPAGNRAVDEAGRGCAVDILRRPRSSGSVLKPFLYAALLDAGRITPTLLVADVPTRIQGYMPENFDHRYRGAVPVREALAQSLNVPAVRLLQDYGVDRFYGQLHALGMTTLFRPAADYGLTLVVGGAEITALDAATLYANLAVRARDWQASDWQRPRLLLNDAATGDAPAKNPAGISRGAAFLTLDALREVARPGDDGNWENFSSSFPVAWKTGTSHGLRDGWAIGVTPTHTVAVWAGNANGEGVAGLTGSSAAAPLMLAIFGALPRAGWFAVPEDDLRTLSVCADDGYLANTDCVAVDSRVPARAHFDRLTPFHRHIQLDVSGRWRVHGDCERVDHMRAVGWFSLPPAMEVAYRRAHPGYRPLPPWRADCRATLATADPDLDVLYPAQDANVYIPVDLDGKSQALVVEAVHRDPEAGLYWHLDGNYLGETRVFHQREIRAAAGPHQLVLVDRQGRRLLRRFTVLPRD